MRLQVFNFVMILLGALVIGSCKKSKSSITQEQKAEKIIITKAFDDNADWNLLVNAPSSEQATIWVDKNNNSVKDADETVSNFGTIFTVPFTGNRTLNIYGKVSEFGCSGNELTSIDVSKSTGLNVLDCSFNRLTALQLVANINLENLDCSYNELPTLALLQNTALKSLSCSYNKLTSLDITKNTKLIYVHALKNLFPTIDVSKNQLLQSLTISHGMVTSLDLTTNTAIRDVTIHRNSINSSNMLQLITSLPVCPATDKGKLYVFYAPDGNILPGSASVSTARSKNWILYQFGTTTWQEMY